MPIGYYHKGKTYILKPDGSYTTNFEEYMKAIKEKKNDRNS